MSTVNSSWGALAVALAAGIGLGLLFFGGLWWTVNQLQRTRHPALLFLGSFLIRTAVVVVGVYFVAGGGLLSIVACMVGFIMVRVVLTRWLGPPVEKRQAATSTIAGQGLSSGRNQ